MIGLEKRSFVLSCLPWGVLHDEWFAHLVTMMDKTNGDNVQNEAFNSW